MEWDDAREQLMEAYADHICQMMPGADREEILRQMREQIMQAEAAREKAMHTPMNEQEAADYLNAILPVLYSHPQAILQ